VIALNVPMSRSVYYIKLKTLQVSVLLTIQIYYAFAEYVGARGGVVG
jgi:hypothetical protein